MEIIATYVKEKKLLKFIMSLRMLKKWGLEWLNLVDMVVSAVLV